MDDSLTIGPERTSTTIGNAQGHYKALNRDPNKFTAALYADFAFTTGRFNGSSFSLFLRYSPTDFVPSPDSICEMAIVGGRGRDCCEWIGVVCHNSTGYVNQLHLAAPPLLEPDFYAPPAEWEAYERIHIPKFFGLLESLTYLNLSQAQFQGAIPHNLGNLSKLQYLDLGGNYLKSKSLQWVSGLSSLQYLDLSGADLSKATDWVQVTFKLPSLLELHLSGCRLEDDPSFISVNSTKSLIVLDLSKNSLISAPKSIFSLHGLVSIDLSENSLEGPIPDYFGNISFLEVLDLTSNHLNSSIPNSLYSLNRLQFLRLSQNQLQGTISSAIGNLSSVTHLDVSENQLNGQIPLSIGELSSLKLFDVSKNQLNGQIPLSIGQLSSLEEFHKIN
ncbi:hypothetical protein J1N35_023830 [Gossypium stocksii]|uniref:Dirigent protein n=1 Tax=Gossypium stocksii TaxID=47602 RepID=A0A9D4A4R9_9ROSI|nr:hypothetical protein J1N35_023830 [Gossypium stocksii]